MRNRAGGNSGSLFAGLLRDNPLRRNAVIWVAVMIAAIAVLGLALTGSGAWLVLVAAAAGLLILSVIDLTQTEHSLRRNFPGAARARWFLENLRPFSRSYLVEGDLDGRPFSHEERDLVYARAHGNADAHPFGTELDVYSGEYEWLAHSMLPNPEADAAMRVMVGSSQCVQP